MQRLSDANGGPGQNLSVLSSRRNSPKDVSLSLHEKRRKQAFQGVWKLLSSKGQIKYDTMDLSIVPIEIIEILMDLFTEFE